MTNKQALFYGVLESINHLRSVFVGHIHFRKFQKIIEMFHCCMTRLRYTNLGAFIQCQQYTRTILRIKNMGQSMFKKHLKFKISMKYFTVA